MSPLPTEGALWLGELPLQEGAPQFACKSTVNRTHSGRENTALISLDPAHPPGLNGDSLSLQPLGACAVRESWLED